MMRGEGKPAQNVSDFMPADAPEFDPTQQSWDNLRKLAKGMNRGTSIEPDGSA